MLVEGDASYVFVEDVEHEKDKEESEGQETRPSFD